MIRRLLPWVAAAAALALFSGLGAWQLQRAADKAALIEALEHDRGAVVESLPSDRSALRAQAFRRVSLQGRFLGQRQFLLDNRIHDGRPGFDVLTPLVLGDGRTVLVDRGWVPWGADRRPARSVALADSDEVRVRGRLWLPEPGIGIGEAVTPGEGWPRLVTRVEFPALAAVLGRELVPAVVRASGDAAWLFRPRDLRPAFGPMRHYGYAFQWFALAVTVVAVACILDWRRRRKEGR